MLLHDAYIMFLKIFVRILLHLLSGEMSLELGLKFVYTPFLKSKQVSKSVFGFFFSLSLSLKNKKV